jgi:hypothetical protein
LAEPADADIGLYKRISVFPAQLTSAKILIKRRSSMADKKITDGLNDRPKNSSIAQTADGLPDDSGQSLDFDEETIEATKRKLSEDPREKLLKEVKQQEDASRLGSE